MKTYPMVMMLLALPFQLQAATLVLPAVTTTATSPNPSANPTTSINIPLVSNISIDTTNAGTASVGAYDLTARGGTRINLLSGLANVRLQTRTTITSTAIQFGTTTTADGGLVSALLGSSASLTAVVNAGITPQWSATIDLSDLGLNLVPNGTYEFRFNLTQSALLGSTISPTVLNSFSVAVEDTVGTINASVLGLTDIVGVNGTAIFRFTTGATVNDPNIRLSGSALLNSGLLSGLLGQPTPNVYTMSALNLTPVPEPDVFVLFGMVGVVLLFRRRAS